MKINPLCLYVFLILSVYLFSVAFPQDLNIDDLKGNLKEDDMDNMEKMRAMFLEMGIKPGDKNVKREGLLKAIGSVMEKTFKENNNFFEEERKKIKFTSGDFRTKLKTLLLQELSKEIPDEIPLDDIFKYMDGDLIKKAQDRAVDILLHEEETNRKLQADYNDEFYEEEPDLSDNGEDVENDNNTNTDNTDNTDNSKSNENDVTNKDKDKSKTDL